MDHQRNPRRVVGFGGALALVWALAALMVGGGWNGETFLPVVRRDFSIFSPTPEAGRLVISEVFYDPSGDEAGEWFEIFNAGGMTLEIGDFKIGDEESAGGGEGMFRFPPILALEAGQRLVIARQANIFRQLYNANPDYELRESDPAVPNLVEYAAWAGGNVELVNSGDEVLVLDRYNRPVDAVSWGSSVWAFDPAAARVEAGQSLERVPAWRDSDSAADWRAGAPGPWLVDLSDLTPTPRPTATLRPSSTPTPTRSPTPTASATLTPTKPPTPPGPVALLVSEVLYDPILSADPAGEWIEIYNASPFTVYLEGYGVGDEELPGGAEGLVRFPAGAQLQPGAVLVVANQASAYTPHWGQKPDYELIDSDPAVPDMIADRNWGTGSLNLSNSGDEVFVIDPVNAFLDQMSWGASSWAFNPPAASVAEGSSLERYPTGVDRDLAADWRERVFPAPGQVEPPPSPTPTFTATPTPTDTGTPTFTATATLTGTLTPDAPTPTLTPLAPGLLLISEVFPNPPGSSEEGEWIEIYNPGAVWISLQGIKVGDEEQQGGPEGMFQFPSQAGLAGGATLVVTNRADVFRELFGLSPDYELIDSASDVPNMLPYAAWGLGAVQLANIGDEVLLLNTHDQVVDQVSWGQSVWAFNPAVPAPLEGQSLERYPPGQDSDTAADWRIQTAPQPGDVDLTEPPTATPVPSITPSPTPTPQLVINEIHADPHLSLGDANNDGVASAGDDEFIEIVNHSGFGVDLSGWQIKDSTAVRHIFPPGSFLMDGCSVVVFGGGNPIGEFGGSLVQIALNGALNLNNSGDIVLLLTASGQLAVGYTYGGEASWDESITRSPDIIGPDPLIRHSMDPGAGGALFSPGVRLDGTFFAGCGGE